MSDHAVFLIHGMWGNTGHFWYVEQQLLQTYPGLKVHACTANEGNKTYDGIDVGGDRVCVEVFVHFMRGNAYWRLKRRWRSGVSKVSLSLKSPSQGIHWVTLAMAPRLCGGGLVSRYVVGLLYAKGVFESITPINFTTFASPHLGIRHMNSGFFHNIANYLGPRLLSASGRQMFIADRNPKPILLRMTEKGTL